MNDHYLFDKRIMKKLLIKYGIMLTGIFILLILINSVLPSDMTDTTVVIIDVAITLFIWLIVEIIIGKIKSKRLEKMEKKKKMEKSVSKDSDIIVIEDAEVKKKDKKQRK